MSDAPRALVSRLAVAIALGALVAILSAGAADAAPRRVSPAALIAAAQAATISEVDYTRADCGDKRRVADWLESVVGANAKSVKWSARRCQLVNKLNPNDAGTGSACAQAVITPKQGKEQATIEVYFDSPRNGRPGKPFAFRAVVRTKDGWDYMRDTEAFEVNWGETYVPGYKAPERNGTCD